MKDTSIPYAHNEGIFRVQEGEPPGNEESAGKSSCLNRSFLLRAFGVVALLVAAFGIGMSLGSGTDNTQRQEPKSSVQEVDDAEVLAYDMAHEGKGSRECCLIVLLEG
jgi:hypothetical protein